MIRDEIKKYLADFQSKSENEISAKFAFLPSFSGFSGHFPGSPVLPGVCQIQCILVVLSEKYKRELSLESVSRAKFLNTVFPGEEITVEGITTEEEKVVSGKFKITKKSPEGQVNVSKISLICGTKSFV